MLNYDYFFFNTAIQYNNTNTPKDRDLHILERQNGKEEKKEKKKNKITTLDTSTVNWYIFTIQFVESHY